MLDEQTLSLANVPAYLVAVKTVKMCSTSAHPLEDREKAAHSLMQEALLMAHMGMHTNLVSLVGFVNRGPTLMLLMSYCEHGALLQLLREHGEVEAHHTGAIEGAIDGADTKRAQFLKELFSENGKLKMMLETSKGMAHLSTSFVHRDLAARNVLIDSKLVCRIADFGLARGLKHTDFGDQASDQDDAAGGADYYRSNASMFPFRSTAPEAMMNSVYTMKSDVWSWSILVIEIYTNGAKPFDHLPNAEVPLAVMQEGLRPERPKNCQPKVFELLQQCWSARPSQRPTFDKVVSAAEFNLDACKGRAQSASHDFQYEISEYMATQHYKEQQHAAAAAAARSDAGVKAAAAREKRKEKGGTLLQKGDRGYIAVKKPREIRRSCITRIDLIGSGNFGDVFTAFIDEEADGGNPGFKAAVKSVSNDPTGEGTKDLLAESLCMAQIEPHKNIVSLIGVVTSGVPLLLVEALCDNGSLLGLLKKRSIGNGPLSPTNGTKKIDADIAIDIAQGMQHLSEKHLLVHRDLAARNVLVDYNLNCKIADFGLSRAYTKESDYYQTETGMFALRWTAPESMSSSKFTSRSDVWAYGVVLLEICSDGENPMKELPNAEIAYKVQNGYLTGNPPQLIEHACLLPMRKLMMECWDLDPLKRPHFSAILDRLEGDEFFVSSIAMISAAGTHGVSSSGSAPITVVEGVQYMPAGGREGSQNNAGDVQYVAPSEASVSISASNPSVLYGQPQTLPAGAGAGAGAGASIISEGVQYVVPASASTAVLYGQPQPQPSPAGTAGAGPSIKAEGVQYDVPAAAAAPGSASAASASSGHYSQPPSAVEVANTLLECAEVCGWTRFKMHKHCCTTCLNTGAKEHAEDCHLKNKAVNLKDVEHTPFFAPNQEAIELQACKHLEDLGFNNEGVLQADSQQPERDTVMRVRACRQQLATLRRHFKKAVDTELPGDKVKMKTKKRREKVALFAVRLALQRMKRSYPNKQKTPAVVQTIEPKVAKWLRTGLGANILNKQGVQGVGFQNLPGAIADQGFATGLHTFQVTVSWNHMSTNPQQNKLQCQFGVAELTTDLNSLPSFRQGGAKSWCWSLEGQYAVADGRKVVGRMPPVPRIRDTVKCTVDMDSKAIRFQTSGGVALKCNLRP